MWLQLSADLNKGSIKALSRIISLVENEVAGYDQFLKELKVQSNPIIGITGPPGSGKSTLVDALIGEWVSEGSRVAVVCIDPASPINQGGALLGDRIRMNTWYNEPRVYIRSLSSKGTLGGLNPHIFDIVTVLQAANFNRILIETVGVGQNEIEIAGLADTTIVVLVPEAGDDIQNMKSGLMEVADIFVVNKTDRPDASLFVNNLKQMMHHSNRNALSIPILQTIASQKKGIKELLDAIDAMNKSESDQQKKIWFLTEKAIQLIQSKILSQLDRNEIAKKLETDMQETGFNFYAFLEKEHYL